MDLSKLTNNPIVKTVLSKQLKSLMVEHNVQLIAITCEDGELKFQVYEGAAVTVIETDELNELKDTIKTLMK